MRFSKVLLSALVLVGFSYSLSGRAIAQLTPPSSPPTQTAPLQTTSEAAPMQAAPSQPAVLVGEGELTDGEDQLKLEDGTPYDYFIFEGNAGERVTLTVDSSDFDPTVGLL